MRLFRRMPFAIFLWSCFALAGCAELMPRDTQSLFVPRLQRSELVGILAGLGTTFAALPDLVAMLIEEQRAA